MSEMWVLLSLKSQSINQGQRLERSLPCYIFFVCHFWWDVALDHWSTRRNICDLRRVFRVRERSVYLREALQSRINPKLFDIQGRFFFCMHFAVGCNNLRRRTSRDLCGFQFGRVQVFPSQHVHCCSRIYNKFSFPWFHYGWRWETPKLVGEKKVALSVSLSFKDILGQSPRVSAGTSLLSFGLLLGPILNFHCVWDCADEEVWLVFYRATDLCFLGC